MVEEGRIERRQHGLHLGFALDCTLNEMKMNLQWGHDVVMRYDQV